jgi:hypothetical protein
MMNAGKGVVSNLRAVKPASRFSRGDQNPKFGTHAHLQESRFLNHKSRYSRELVKLLLHELNKKAMYTEMGPVKERSV